MNDRAYTIHFSSLDEVVLLRNVLFGDVWVCSGQSNMVMSIKGSFDNEQTFKDADDYQTYRLMRIMSIGEKWSHFEQEDFDGDFQLRWSYPNSTALGINSDSFGYFSAACFYYGLSLYKRTYV